METENFEIHKIKGTITFVGETKESKKRKGLFIKEFGLTFHDYRGQMQTCKFVAYGEICHLVEKLSGLEVMLFFNLSGFTEIKKTGVSTIHNRLVVRNIMLSGKKELTEIQEIIEKQYKNYKIMEEENE